MTASIEPLSDCATWYSGGTPKTSVDEYWGGPIPWITSGSLTQFRLRDSERRLTELGLNNGSRLVPAGSTLFVVRGMSLNSEFRVGIAQRDLAFGQDCKALVAREGILPEYLAYSVAGRSREVLSMVDQAAHGTGRLPTDLIGSLGIRVVSLEEQEQVVGILSAFDDLIENNRRRIEILEEMARLLYREWFVHFRFPGHEDVEMVDSELGPIPGGWEVVALSDVSEVNPESVRKGDALGEILYLDISSVGPRTVDEPEAMPFSEAPGRARRRVAHGDVIWSTVRPNRRSHVMIQHPPANLICSTGFAVLRGTSVPPSFVLELTSTESFVGHLESLATGAAYPAVRPPDFEAYRFALPNDTLVEEWDSQVAAMNKLVSNLRQQNRILREARDLLIPRLVSGELDVSDLNLDEVLA